MGGQRRITPARFVSMIANVLALRLSFDAESRRGRRFGSRLLAITPIETIHATRRVNQFLLARKKRMASRTNLNVQIPFARRARLKSLAASASHSDFLIFRMNSGFHFVLTLVLLPVSRIDETVHDTSPTSDPSSQRPLSFSNASIRQALESLPALRGYSFR